MKDYLFGIAIFLGLLVLVGNVSLKQMGRVNVARETLDDARIQLRSSESSRSSKNIQLMAQFGNSDVTRFMRDNGATLQSMKEIGSINQRVGSESEALRIPIQEQKTEIRAMKGRQGTTVEKVSMHQYSITILSTFRDSLVWMGKMEDAFPFARIESISFTPSGDYVNLQTRILFPNLDQTILSQ